MSAPTTAAEQAEELVETLEARPFDDRRIVKYDGDGVAMLRRVADPVRAVDAEIAALIADMSEVMRDAHGVGLAAPQIGKSIRLLVYDAGDGLRTLVNPAIVKMKGEQWEPEEGCLSIPGLRGVVKRANEIVVKAQDGDGKPIRFRATEFEARVIQHEVDHLDGVLFIDRAEPDTLHIPTPDDEEEAPPE